MSECVRDLSHFLSLGVLHDVTIEVHGNGQSGMPEDVLQGFGIHSFLDASGGKGMPECVEGCPCDISAFFLHLGEDPAHFAPEIVPVDWRTVAGSKDQIRKTGQRLPVFTIREAMPSLGNLPGPEEAHCLLGQGDDSAAVLTLRLLEEIPDYIYMIAKMQVHNANKQKNLRKRIDTAKSV